MRSVVRNPQPNGEIKTRNRTECESSMWVVAAFKALLGTKKALENSFYVFFDYSLEIEFMFIYQKLQHPLLTCSRFIFFLFRRLDTAKWKWKKYHKKFSEKEKKLKKSIFSSCCLVHCRLHLTHLHLANFFSSTIFPKLIDTEKSASVIGFEVYTTIDVHLKSRGWKKKLKE